MDNIYNMYVFYRLVLLQTSLGEILRNTIVLASERKYENDKCLLIDHASKLSRVMHSTVVLCSQRLRVTQESNLKLIFTGHKKNVFYSIGSVF